MTRSGFLTLALMSATVAVPTARAESPVPVVRAEESVGPSDPEPIFPVLGASLGVGAPEGASFRAELRPWRALRLHGGVAYNLVSPGVLGGVEVVPFATVVAPTLLLEAGHFFEGDASGPVHALAGVDLSKSPTARRLSYDFATAQLGLEIGSPRFMTFGLHVGLSVVQGRLREFQTLVQGGSLSASLSADDPQVRVVIPSARVGLTFFLG